MLMVWRRVLVSAASVMLLALPKVAECKRRPARVFTVADGLPDNDINCVYEDARGFVWVGTNDGLARFDGRRFETYDVTDGLPNPAVQDVVETSDGSLWLATGAGVARLEPSRPATGPTRFRTYRLGDEMIADAVRCLHTDRTGRVWAGSDGGLFLLEPGRRAFHRVPLGLARPSAPFVIVNSIREGPDGSLWIGTRWALVRILPDGRQVRYVSAEPARHRGVRSVLADPGGRIWIGWEEGVTIFRPPPLRRDDSEVVVPHTQIRCKGRSGPALLPGQSCEISQADGLPDSWCSIHASSGGLPRLLTEKGLCALGETRILCDETAASFVPSKLMSLNEDRYGNLWIGTETGGLIRIARAGASTYTAEDGLLANGISSVFEGSDGELYVETVGAALHRLDGDHFVGVVPLLPRSITYVGWGWNQIALQDANREWWYATGQGLARYPAVTRLEELARTAPKRLYTTRDGLPADNVFRLFQDSRGDVWISTLDVSVPGSERLTRWERAADRLRACPPAFPNNSATAFAEDRLGRVWIGFYAGGIARYRDGRFDLFRPGPETPRGFVGQILADARGRLWIATSLSGVARVDDPGAAHPSFRMYGRAQGLSSDRAYSLTEDASGHLYVATSRGIDRLDPATGKVLRYAVAEGLASTPTLAAFRDRHGRIWFGTLRGLYRFDPQPEPTSAPPKVLVTDLEINGEALPLPVTGVPGLELPTLSHDQNEVRIRFVAPNPAPGDEILYRYRLEAGGRDWSEPSPDDTVQYAALAPGSYRFLVQAVSSGGTVSRAPASVTFRIRPPFWRSWWFEIGAAVLAALILASLYRLRVRRLLEVERVRSRIAADLHDDLGTSLYRISLLSEVASRQAASGSSEVRSRLAEIGETARELIDSAGDIVWSSDPRRDDLASLLIRIRRFASDMLDARGVSWSLEGPPDAGRIVLAAQSRRHLYLVLKESIRNALRHGNPSHIRMSLALSDGHVEADIRDDGRGFSPEALETQKDPEAGYGLASMLARAREMGGEFRLSSEPGEGTHIYFSVPLTAADGMSMLFSRLGRIAHASKVRRPSSPRGGDHTGAR
jgi:signal transduction histidine kinase/ligand-binding sensor domain-containing protein